MNLDEEIKVSFEKDQAQKQGILYLELKKQLDQYEKDFGYRYPENSENAKNFQNFRTGWILGYKYAQLKD